ncbi:hypothetical protein EV361DRAFT_169577 [Lentinula raphanica]|nr:hypothetical protein EV361DRAFT_169577 [Lentinula raphanica]
MLASAVIQVVPLHRSTLKTVLELKNFDGQLDYDTQRYIEKEDRFAVGGLQVLPQPVTISMKPWLLLFLIGVHGTRRSLPLEYGSYLGGSSSANAMMGARPTFAGMDAIAALGNPGWGWNDFLPYMKNSESLRFRIQHRSVVLPPTQCPCVTKHCKEYHINCV